VEDLTVVNTMYANEYVMHILYRFLFPILSTFLAFWACTDLVVCPQCMCVLLNLLVIPGPSVYYMSAVLLPTTLVVQVEQSTHCVCVCVWTE